MAKLTLSFKDRKLKVFALPSADCLIGRDPGCSIVIDSLAIEPQHARIRAAGEEFTVEPVNENTAVLVNDLAIGETRELREGDLIQIGKHTLRFSQDSEGPSLESGTQNVPRVGWLQIQNGAHLGRTIRLNKAFTRVGKPDGHLAIIARRDNGYFVSHLQGETTPLLNDQDIGDATHKLNDGDQLSVGVLQVQFFADTDSAQHSELPVVEQEETQQRQFSRIPFDVSATLRSDEQSWETDLLDISLHGALIKIPEAFEPDAERQYQLAIHLEGGPDICMDVSIAHQENQQLGLRCEDIDVESITHLRRLVELNVGDAGILERELSALG
jgi:pSer/pThr/pTyr-binding forkhead associated (FHA) protein